VGRVVVVDELVEEVGVGLVVGGEGRGHAGGELDLSGRRGADPSVGGWI
jgi:hypothetical protein